VRLPLSRFSAIVCRTRHLVRWLAGVACRYLLCVRYVTVHSPVIKQSMHL